MRARPVTDEELRNWDDLVRESPRAHLLQSTGWARVKAATGWVAERYVLEDDRGRRGLAQVLRRKVAGPIAAAYVPRGPLCDDEVLPDAIAALRTALAAQPTTSLLCDPEAEASPALHAALALRGVRVSPVYVQPRRTLLVDLSADPEALLAGMRKKTRQYVRKAEREGVATEESTDLARFHRLLRLVAARDGFGIHDLGYFASLADAFGDALHLLMARIDGEDVGALLVIRMGDRAWELFGGWSGTHAERRPFYLLKWRSLLRMRQLGVRRYDMWGLAEGEELSGVENFKVGFGGRVTTWVGALETPVTPLLFPLWRFGARQRLAATSA